MSQRPNVQALDLAAAALWAAFPDGPPADVAEPASDAATARTAAMRLEFSAEARTGRRFCDLLKERAGP